MGPQTKGEEIRRVPRLGSLKWMIEVWAFSALTDCLRLRFHPYSKQYHYNYVRVKYFKKALKTAIELPHKSSLHLQTLPVVPLYGDMHINVYLCPRDQKFTSYELDPGKWTCVSKDVVKVIDISSLLNTSRNLFPSVSNRTFVFTCYFLF